MRDALLLFCCFVVQSVSPSFGGRVTFSLRGHAPAGASANSEAGPKGVGQDARSKEKVTKEKGHPAWRLPGIPARQVREARTGFSTGLLS